MVQRRSSEEMHLAVAGMGGSTLAFSNRDIIMLNVEVSETMAALSAVGSGPLFELGR